MLRKILLSAAIIAIAPTFSLADTWVPNAGGGYTRTQTSDPYADSDRKQKSSKYVAYRDRVMDSVKLFYFAAACRVIEHNVADNFRNFYTTPLYQSLEFLGAEPVNSIVARYQAAERDGTALAAQGCDFFKDRPEIVRTLREMRQRGVH